MLLSLLAAATALAPSVVTIEPTEEGWRLMRNGEPYHVYGAGGTNRKAELAALGANSIRTWGAEDAQRHLDEAHALGMTVTLGIWLGHPKHGTDYSDPEQMTAQAEMVREIVTMHRDHPALLMWSLGNEMEIDGDDPNIWIQIEKLAQIVKELDPNHPVISVTAGINPLKIQQINDHAPSLDALGINAYAGMAETPLRAREWGWERPFLITEFGARGQWESPRTGWGSPFEENTTQKGLRAIRNWEIAVRDDPWALGSYTFLWGQDEPVLHRWFSMHFDDGTLVEHAIRFNELWTGETPENEAPQILSFDAGAAGRILEPGEESYARVAFEEPDGDDVRIRWEVRTDDNAPEEIRLELESSTGIVEGGDFFTFEAPEVPGPYRVIVYLDDGRGAGATANMPFYVEAP